MRGRPMPGGLSGEERRGGGRCPEARLLASDLDLELLQREPRIDGGLKDVIERRFHSRSRLEQIAAAVELRKAFVKLSDEVQIRRAVIHLRERFATVAGRMRAERYKARPVDQASEAELHAEAISLLDELARVYALSLARDRELDALRRWCLGGLGVAAVAITLLAGATSYHTLLGLEVGPGGTETVKLAAAQLPDETAFKWHSLVNYLVVMLFAAAGAIVSIVQRSHAAARTPPMAADPVVQISGLRSGLSGLAMAALTGPVFAMVMLAVFAAGGLEIGALTPAFKPCSDFAAPGFMLLDRCAAVATWSDAAKLLVWAFLAGFAERLVPDVLDRFVGAAKKQEAQERHE
jgi:hypothetical protein